MRNTFLLLAVLSTTLAGCMATDGQRALMGAAAGAVIADANDGNVIAGAATGAAAGALCDDAGICN